MEEEKDILCVGNTKMILHQGNLEEKEQLKESLISLLQLYFLFEEKGEY